MVASYLAQTPRDARPVLFYVLFPSQDDGQLGGEPTSGGVPIYTLLLIFVVVEVL